MRTPVAATSNAAMLIALGSRSIKEKTSSDLQSFDVKESVRLSSGFFQ
jgi:hypothetical protein